LSSFNFDMTGLLDVAANLFNGLWPIFAIIAGLSLSAGLLVMVTRSIKNIFSGSS